MPMRADIQNRLSPPIAQPAKELNPAAVSTQKPAVDSTGPRDEIDFKSVLYNAMQDTKREREAKANGDLSGAETNEQFLERLAEQSKQDEKRAPKNHMDKDDFMHLFITQLKHQDPLNPDDGAEMAAKLAQFNSLEQLMNVNTTLKSLVDAENNGRSFMLSNFIGKEISVDGGRVRIDKEGVSNGTFELRSGATNAKLEVRDGSGTVVFEKDLGTVPAGKHPVDWSGKGRDGEALTSGLYTFNVSAYDIDNREIPVDISSKVKILGIDISDMNGAMFTDFGRVELGAVRAVGESGFDHVEAQEAKEKLEQASADKRKTSEVDLTQQEVEAAENAASTPNAPEAS